MIRPMDYEEKRIEDVFYQTLAATVAERDAARAEVNALREGIERVRDVWLVEGGSRELSDAIAALSALVTSL